MAPSMPALVMAAATHVFYVQSMALLDLAVVSTFGAVFFGCGVYIAVMLLTGGLREDDLERIPMIGRFGIKFLRRIGVFKAKAE